MLAVFAICHSCGTAFPSGFFAVLRASRSDFPNRRLKVPICSPNAQNRAGHDEHALRGLAGSHEANFTIADPPAGFSEVASRVAPRGGET
jgi:hypothetical protein